MFASFVSTVPVQRPHLNAIVIATTVVTPLKTVAVAMRMS